MIGKVIISAEENAKKSLKSYHLRSFYDNFVLPCSSFPFACNRHRNSQREVPHYPGQRHKSYFQSDKLYKEKKKFHISIKGDDYLIPQKNEWYYRNYSVNGSSQSNPGNRV